MALDMPVILVVAMTHGQVVAAFPDAEFQGFVLHLRFDGRSRRQAMGEVRG